MVQVIVLYYLLITGTFCIVCSRPLFTHNRYYSLSKVERDIIGRQSKYLYNAVCYGLWRLNLIWLRVVQYNKYSTGTPCRSTDCTCTVLLFVALVLGTWYQVPGTPECRVQIVPSAESLGSLAKTGFSYAGLP